MVLSDLDRKSKQVLEAMYEHDGEARVGEVSDFTGIKSTQIHYRIDEKLEPGGLVESRKIDGEGPMGVKVVTLTDDGTEVVGKVLDGDSGPTVVEEVRELRAVVEDLHDSLQSFGGRVDHVEELVEEVESRAADAERAASKAQESAEDVEDLRERIEEAEEHPLEDRIDEKIEELETLTERFQYTDQMNNDVRSTLWRYGVLKADRKHVHDEEIPPEFRGGRKQQQYRDGYSEGSLLEKLKQLDEEGTLDALISEEGDVSRESAGKKKMTIDEYVEQTDFRSMGFTTAKELDDHLCDVGFDHSKQKAKELAEEQGLLLQGYGDL